MHTPGKGMSGSALPYKLGSFLAEHQPGGARHHRQAVSLPPLRAPSDSRAVPGAASRRGRRSSRRPRAVSRAIRVTRRARDPLGRDTFFSPHDRSLTLRASAALLPRRSAKKGMTPSQIGVLLRDNHGVAQVNSVTNSKILRILKGQGLAPALPEDLCCLYQEGFRVANTERNRKDMDSKFRLILSSPASTAWRATTSSPRSSRPTGSTTPPPRPPPRKPVRY